MYVCVCICLCVKHVYTHTHIYPTSNANSANHEIKFGNNKVMCNLALRINAAHISRINSGIKNVLKKQ